MGNQKPKIKEQTIQWPTEEQTIQWPTEEQTIQWPTEERNRDKQ